MPLTTFSANTTIKSAEVNANFALCLLKADVATSGGVLFGNGTTAVQSATLFYWNNTSYRLSINSNADAYALNVTANAAHTLAAEFRLGSSASTGGLHITNNAGTIEYSFWQCTSSTVTFGSNSASSVALYTNGLARMTIATDGKVGFGTASASSGVHIVGNTYTESSVKSQIIVQSETAYNSSPVSGIYFGTKYNSSGDYAGGGAIQIGKENATDGNTAFYMSFYTRSAGGTLNTERLRIDSSGNIGIGLVPTSRNNTTLQIVNAIGFPATQVSSSDANSLDDYEEGTFTPTVTTGSGTITSFGTRSGIYTKIGDTVSVTVTIPITNNGTGAGDVRVTNMPFTGNAIAQCGAGREMQSTGNGLFGYINNSSTTLVIQKYDGTYPGGTNYTINFTITYKL